MGRTEDESVVPRRNLGGDQKSAIGAGQNPPGSHAAERPVEQTAVNLQRQTDDGPPPPSAKPAAKPSAKGVQPTAPRPEVKAAKSPKPAKASKKPTQPQQSDPKAQPQAAPTAGGKADKADKPSLKERAQQAGKKASGKVGAVGAGAAGGAAAAKSTDSSSASSAGKTRTARLRLVRVDAWSVMKTSFLLSIAIAIVTIVAMMLIYIVLGVSGVWDNINAMFGGALDGAGSSNFDIRNYVGMGRVMGITMIIAVLDIILITAVATLAAFLYNLAATLLGGVEVTLAEDR